MHPISYIEKRFLWDWVEQQDGETWCDAFCEHLTEHGFHWVKKHVDSQVWTGVSRTRLYILFADDTIGGQLAVEYFAATWDAILDSISAEEAVGNHAVVIAVADSRYEGFIREIKD